MDPINATRAVAKHKKAFGMAELRRPPTGQYNCHGLTFANRRTGIHHPLAVAAILEDDGYRQIRASEVCLGDVVVYYDGREITHTGIVVRIERDETLIGGQAVWIISKWGQAAEYIHPVSLGPYGKHDLTYWTDRP